VARLVEGGSPPLAAERGLGRGVKVSSTAELGWGGGKKSRQRVGETKGTKVTKENLPWEGETTTTERKIERNRSLFVNFGQNPPGK